MEGTSRLLIVCPDRPGIVAAVAGFLRDVGANITHSDQHSTDPSGGTFLMRMEFTLPVGEAELAGLKDDFENRVARPFGMRWQLFLPGQRKRIAILASREDHCLLDLIWRWRREELEGEIVLIASNHPDLRGDVDPFGLPYHHVPVDQEHKAKAESALLEILRADDVDLVVLARYMQVLSGDFLNEVAAPVINIHHSFLPAFAGAGAYQKARERGVKLIGATAHYVTEELDAGPIIEQDVIRVTHREDLAGLERLGRDIERTVLARAVTWHCQDRVLVHGNTTVVF